MTGVIICAGICGFTTRVTAEGMGGYPHVSCPVISGVLKTLEVSVGLALPGDVAITFK